MGSSTDDQQQQLHKQVSEPKSISDFIDLCLLVCRGIDYIKSDTNSEFPNMRCGILAPVCVISTNINSCTNKFQSLNRFRTSWIFTCRCVLVLIPSSPTLIQNSRMCVVAY